MHTIKVNKRGCIYNQFYLNQIQTSNAQQLNNKRI